MRHPPVNVVVISGNLSRDPELKYTAKGTPVLMVGFVHNKNFKNAAGDWDSKPSFWDAVVYGQAAERYAEYLKKGDCVVVQGRLEKDEWEKEGVKKTVTRIIANTVTSLEARPAKPETPKSDDVPPPAEDAPF